MNSVVVHVVLGRSHHVTAAAPAAAAVVVVLVEWGLDNCEWLSNEGSVHPSLQVHPCVCVSGQNVMNYYAMLKKAA